MKEEKYVERMKHLKCLKGTLLNGRTISIDTVKREVCPSSVKVFCSNCSTEMEIVADNNKQDYKYGNGKCKCGTMLSFDVI